MPQPTEYEQISWNSADGEVIGRTSTDSLAFYGNTPVARPFTASTSNVSTTIGRSTSSAAVTITTWGFQTQAEIDIMVTAVSTMQYTMKQLGLIAGGVQAALTYSSEPFEILDYGSPDGAQFGRTSADLIGFYGATPSVRNSGTTNDVSTTTTVSASTNGVATVLWGWRTSSEFATITAAVSTMQLAMKRIGLMV